jgi:DNA repair protein RecN (Recombination protein N)
MLRALSIRNVVLIDRLDLALEGGLCVLTGETGAGKSILLDALGLALGQRAETRLVRAGAAQASVCASFDLPADHPARNLLADQGMDGGEDELLLRRTLTSDGRSRAFVNDQPASAAFLRTLGDGLIEIQGQFEQQGLLDSARHRVLLDQFGGLADPAAETAQLWDDWRGALRACEEARSRLSEARSDEALLRHAVAEMEALDPQAGETAALAEQRTRLMHREQLVEAINAATAALAGVEGGGGAEAGLNVARRQLERAADKAGGGLETALAGLDHAAAELAEALAALEAFSADLDLDAGRLAEIEDRFFALKELARKHGCDPDGLPGLRDEMAARLAALDSGGEDLAALERAAAARRDGYLRAARALGKGLRAAAERLDRAVTAELPPLKLEKARFATRVEAIEDETAWGAHGLDRVSFEVATNPGAPPGPIARIASGGELSRFLLAIKVVLAGVGPPASLVFDEVDSGIGGAAADAVGARLERLAEGRQILVVTHSPQVAARAAHHWRVGKEPQGEHLVTRVVPLDAAARREEIARMLSGKEVTEEARAAAGRLMGAA